MPRGSIFGLLGPNGAGKTTLIRLILGLVRPDAGEIRLFGEPVTRGRLAPALSRIGTLVEAASFYPYLSGFDNLRVIALTANRPPDERILAALDQVGLADRAHDRAGTYSLGMKQRLGLAGALLKDPEVLILDEPTNGLDPAGTHQIRQFIRSLAGTGVTVLLCSHLLSEVEQVCTDLAILRSGRVVAAGSAPELLGSHGAPIVAIRVPSDQIPKALDLLSVEPEVARATLHDEWIEVEAPHPLSGRLARALMAQEVTVEELVRRTPSLEALFLELTDEPTASIGAISLGQRAAR